MKISNLPMIGHFNSLLDEIHKNGFRQAVRYACYRVAEHYGDWRVGIQTGRYLSKKELDYGDTSLNLEYEATSYQVLGRVFDRVPIRPGLSVCVDYGCGMGRVVIYAARRGFRKVIGVEYSGELVEMARQNVQRAVKRLRCPVEIVHADAQSYSVPDDVDVIFMFRPFRAITLANVIENIHKSLLLNPRKIWLIFYQPWEFEELVKGKNWVEKTYENFCFNKVRYAIYCCHESLPKRAE
jgi:SAM-dependent methyltransferase